MRANLHLALALAASLACVHAPSSKERRGSEIHHDLGAEALGQGRAPDALREFDAAIAADGSFAEAHRGRGLVLDLGFGRTEEAEAAYRRALALRPSYSEAHNDLGQLLAKTGRHAEALAAFDRALENMLYKEPYIARCNRGLTLHAMGRRDDGIAEIRAALAVAPSFCKGRRELGRLLVDEGRTKEGLEELSAYARLCGRVPDAHLQLGLARMKAGDLGGAREAFERCRDLGGTSADGEDCRRRLTLLE